ncbi:sulfotransferase family protein [bacterium]|nr:sulfotransferase family protein [bacterium]
MQNTNNNWITIVSGLPRSGTSMMMRMLEAGGISPLTDKERTPDEDNPNGYYELEIVKQIAKDDTWLADAPGLSVKMIYSLLKDLPADDRYQYRVLFMRRELDEVLASQARMLQRSGKESNVPDAYMKTLFQRELEKFDVWVAGQPSIKMMDVNYNGILHQSDVWLNRIAMFLDGEVDPVQMASIIDRSLYRNRAAA